MSDFGKGTSREEGLIDLPKRGGYLGYLYKREINLPRRSVFFIPKSGLIYNITITKYGLIYAIIIINIAIIYISDISLQDSAKHYFEKWPV